MTLLLIGYAVGTIQILVVEWWRSVRHHRLHLRLLISDLRGVRRNNNRASIEAFCEGTTPVPPSVSAIFKETIGVADFSLSDQFRDGDNIQEALLSIGPNLDQLERGVGEMRLGIEVHEEETPAIDSPEIIARLSEMATQYNKSLDAMQDMVDDMIEHLEVRLADMSLWRQINRLIWKLPEG